VIGLRTMIRLADGLDVNPYTPEAARLVECAYDHWRPERFEPWRTGSRAFKPWGPVPGWTMEPAEWDNVQAMLCSRPLRADEVTVPQSPELQGVRLEGGTVAEIRQQVVDRIAPRLLALVLPGTNQLADWTHANLLGLPVRVGGLPGMWRRGFSVGAEWAWAQLRGRFREGDRVLITGHSYGGAMSLDAGAVAVRDGLGDRVLGLLAFAPPRATSRDGAQLLNRAYPFGVGQRFVLGFDIVPWSVIPGYWHHALQPVFIGSDGEVGVRYRFWFELGRALRQRGIQAIGHHGMRNYLAWAESLPAPAEAARA
jgi:hypothetical protein